MKYWKELPKFIHFLTGKTLFILSHLKRRRSEKCFHFKKRICCLIISSLALHITALSLIRVLSKPSLFFNRWNFLLIFLIVLEESIMTQSQEELLAELLEQQKIDVISLSLSLMCRSLNPLGFWIICTWWGTVVFVDFCKVVWKCL